MYPIILEYENAIGEEDLAIMQEIAESYGERQWTKMNDEPVTGSFWLGKRMMIEDHALPTWHEKIINLRSEIDFSDITDPRKIQRFNNGDVLGPLSDADHVSSIRYGSILFLNEPDDAEIFFPKLNYKVKAKTNKLVVYGADQEYIIRGPEGQNYLYFSTVFMS